MDGHVLMDMNETISQEYSSSHKAIDIVGKGNTTSDVIAFESGTVEIVVNTVTGSRKGSRGTASYGNFVKIRHDNGMKTLYAHMEYGSVSVKAGDHINKGQKIGRMGDTGNAYGVHLHFEIRGPDEKRINPYPYLFEGKPIIESNKEDISEENSTLTSNDSTEVSLGETKENKTNETLSNRDSIGFSQINNIEDNTIEVENPDNNSISYFEENGYVNGSIVDGLKSVGADSSFDYRTLLAYENGIHNYRGSYEQNVQLLLLFKTGKLKKI